MEIFDGDLIQVGPMVLTLSIKAKGESPKPGLAHAPEGWPFLEGADEPAVRPTSAMPPHKPGPRLAPAPEPARLEALIPGLATIGADQALAATMSPAASATATATATAVAPTRPHRPIAIQARTVGHRAIECRMVDDVMVVSLLAPDLNEEETVSPFRYELRTLLEGEKVATRMVIDMRNTRYLSSRAVGVLLAHYQGLERIGSTMRVCGVSKEIKPVLDQMRLSMLIDIYPSVEEAVQDSWD